MRNVDVDELCKPVYYALLRFSRSAMLDAVVEHTYSYRKMDWSEKTRIAILVILRKRHVHSAKERGG